MKNKIMIGVMVLLGIIITLETIHIYNLETSTEICDSKVGNNGKSEIIEKEPNEKCEKEEQDDCRELFQQYEDNKFTSAEYLYESEIKEYKLRYKYYLVNEGYDNSIYSYEYSLMLSISGECGDLGTYSVYTLYSDDKKYEEDINKYIYKYTAKDITKINDKLIVMGITNEYFEGAESYRTRPVAFYLNDPYRGYDEVIYVGPSMPPVFVVTDKTHKLYKRNFYIEDNKIYLFKFSNEYYCENGYGADCLYETIIEFDGKDYKEYKGEKVMGIGAGLE